MTGLTKTYKIPSEQKKTLGVFLFVCFLSFFFFFSFPFWTGCPEGLWHFHPWRYSEPNWMLSWTTWSSWLGLDDFRSSLPSSTILWLNPPCPSWNFTSLPGIECYVSKPSLPLSLAFSRNSTEFASGKNCNICLLFSWLHIKDHHLQYSFYQWLVIHCYLHFKTVSLPHLCPPTRPY